MNQLKKMKTASASSSSSNGERQRVGSAQNGKKKKTLAQRAAELRVQKDVAELDKIEGVRVEFGDADDLMQFKVYITPLEGLYEGATYQFSCSVPADYPFNAPKVHCDTLIYHPNIDMEGHVCLNILREDWSPVLNVTSVLFGLLTLFYEPNPEDPLNKEAAQLMVDDRARFEQIVARSLRGATIAGRRFPKLK
jgi:ubiquitin-conjugating enzyme E2 M